MLRKIFSNYEMNKQFIKARIDYFRAIWEKSEERIFSELCFCLCTPQSNAVSCYKAISKLYSSRILFTGTREQIREALAGVRFPEVKSQNIIEARELFMKGGKVEIKKYIDPHDVFQTREWLIRNVKGLGLKEASHFLRNIGFGEQLAILDRHILKNLLDFQVLEEIPKHLTTKTYFQIERKMAKFSSYLGIPLPELDLLLWSMETGKIFK